MSDEADRSHDPTPRRLEEARRRGDGPRSPDAATALAYLGLTLGLATLGAAGVVTAASRAMVLLGDPAAVIGQGLSASRITGTLSAIVAPVLPMLLIPGVVVLAGLAALGQISVARERLRPRLTRIDPIAALKHRFGLKGLMEFGKNVLRLTLVMAIATWILRRSLPLLVATMDEGPAQVTAVFARLVLSLTMAMAALAVAIAASDMVMQFLAFLRRNRMTRQEVIDEYRQAEGDPHMKQHRRQRAREIATNRMLADVPGADVVIVNPTHYAVALRWSRGAKTAPVCVAKGVDEIAARIRDIAMEAAVPIHSDPPTARAIHASVDIGAEIRPDHYAAVAAAIRFAEAMRARAKAAGRTVVTDPAQPGLR